MSAVVDLSFPFFGLIFLGFLAARLMKAPEAGLQWMNLFLIYFSLPALFFQLLSRTPVAELANGRFVIATTGATALTFTIAFLYARFVARRSAADAGILALVGGYANVGYMGPGLTLAVLGTGASVPTALVLCFDNMLLFTLMPVLMALANGAGEPLDRVVGRALFRVATHPFIVSSVAGIVAAIVGFHPPAALDTLLTLLRQAAAPSALFALGVTLGLRPFRGIPKVLPPVLAMKLVLHPLLAFTFVSLIAGLDPVFLATAILMASLPPAANVYVMAAGYDAFVDGASTAVLVGTLLSVVTVTGVIFLITHGMI